MLNTFYLKVLVTRFNVFKVVIEKIVVSVFRQAKCLKVSEIINEG